jgi:hypothetical protein
MDCYTKERPHTAGYYWLLQPNSEPIVVEVFYRWHWLEGGFRCVGKDLNASLSSMDPDCWWAPAVPPSLPVEVSM